MDIVLSGYEELPPGSSARSSCADERLASAPSSHVEVQSLQKGSHATRSLASFQPGAAPSSLQMTALELNAEEEDGGGGDGDEGATNHHSAQLAGLSEWERVQMAQEACQNIVMSLDSLPGSFKKNELMVVAANPFKMAFPSDVEKEYREWIHMKYIPSCIWLVVAAFFFFAELDIFTYGMKLHTVDVLLMHGIAFVQVVMAVLLSIPALYPYRRYLVLSLGLHTFFWSGLETQQAADRVSGVHQNTFIALPYYCSFACVMAASVCALYANNIHSVVFSRLCLIKLLHQMWIPFRWS